MTQTALFDADSVVLLLFFEASETLSTTQPQMRYTVFWGGADIH